MTTPDFSVKNLIRWVETQPPQKVYDWSSARNCLLGQWCKSLGMKGDELFEKSIALAKLDTFYDIALRESHKCTFGDALERARRFSE